MPACRFMEQCIFFIKNMSEMPSTAEIIKTRYCKEGGNPACARFMVCEKLGMEKVPPDLLPNQMDRIDEILSDI